MRINVSNIKGNKVTKEEMAELMALTSFLGIEESLLFSVFKKEKDWENRQEDFFKHFANIAINKSGEEALEAYLEILIFRQFIVFNLAELKSISDEVIKDYFERADEMLIEYELVQKIDDYKKFRNLRTRRLAEYKTAFISRDMLAGFIIIKNIFKLNEENPDHLDALTFGSLFIMNIFVDISKVIKENIFEKYQITVSV